MPTLQHLRSDVPEKRPDPALLAPGQLAQNRAITSPGLFFSDAAGGLCKAGPTHVGPTAPNSTPAGTAGNSVGETWLNTGLTKPVLNVWDGFEWVKTSSSGSGCWVSDTPPTEIEQGSLWWNSELGTLFVWYDDGDTQQWVEASPGTPVDTSNFVKKTGDTMTGNLTVPSLNGGQLAGFRNVLINGCLRVNQRGAVSYTTDAVNQRIYTYDRLFVIHRQITTVTRQPMPANAFGLAYCVSGSTATFFSQNVELPAAGLAGPFAVGTTWTLSFVSDQPVTGVSAAFHDGTVDAGSVGIFSGTPVSTGVTSGGFTRYYCTFQVAASPSTTNTTVRVVFDTPANVRIGGLQLEPGPVATPFEHRPIGAELALCQRYFYLHSRPAGAGQVSTTGWNVGKSSYAGSSFIYQFPVQMRTVPSCSPFPTLTKRGGPGVLQVVDQRVSNLLFVLTPYFSADGGAATLVPTDNVSFSAEL